MAGFATSGQPSHVVQITTWARNQREDDVMPGTALIALPHRAASDGDGRTIQEAAR